MKSLIILIIVFAFLIKANGQTVESLKWHTNIDSAKTEAKALNKIILMDFTGSDWCANCIRLERALFTTEEFAKYADKNLVLLKLDFPSKKKNSLSPEQIKHNEQLAEKYNKQGAFPTVLFLDAEENILGKLKQPQNKLENYIENMESILNKVKI